MIIYAFSYLSCFSYWTKWPTLCFPSPDNWELFLKPGKGGPEPFVMGFWWRQWPLKLLCFRKIYWIISQTYLAKLSDLLIRKLVRYYLLLEMCYFPVLYHGLILVWVWGPTQRPLGMKKIRDSSVLSCSLNLGIFFSCLIPELSIEEWLFLHGW